MGLAQTNPTLLIVDDEPVLRELYSFVLTGLGYTVQEAANGAEAWGRLRNQALPSVILLDLRMPIMSGLEVLNSMQCEPALRDCPVIVMSASQDLLELHYAPNVVAVLSKPFSLDVLTDTVAGVVGVERGALAAFV